MAQASGLQLRDRGFESHRSLICFRRLMDKPIGYGPDIARSNRAGSISFVKVVEFIDGVCYTI